jgi:recombination protein RecR
VETFSPTFNRITALLSRLPGIGQKTAARLAFFILKSEPKYAHMLADELKQLHQKIRYCSICGMLTEQDPCPVCTSSRRDTHTLCVVENPTDALKIEQTGEYRGLYHILMGSLSPLNRITPDKLRIKELVQRIRDNHVEEVIFATNPTVEGDTTALYITSLLEKEDIRITRLGKGLPTGGDLELADTITLLSAIKNRENLRL